VAGAIPIAPGFDTELREDGDKGPGVLSNLDGGGSPGLARPALIAGRDCLVTGAPKRRSAPGVSRAFGRWLDPRPTSG
jgi:hypothetical protein